MLPYNPCRLGNKMLFRDLDSELRYIRNVTHPKVNSELDRTILALEVYLIRKYGNRLYNPELGGKEVPQDVLHRFGRVRETYETYITHLIGDVGDGC